MKHIFTVHSPITFYCALEVINHEGLHKNNVIMLCSGYKPPINIGVTVASYSETQKSFFHRIKHFNLAKHFDKFINGLTKNQDFTAYIDLVHYYQRLLITNVRCKNFHFIEEGTASYMIPKDLNSLTHIERSREFRNFDKKELLNSIIRVSRGFNLRLLSIPYHPLAFRFIESIKYYTFSEDGYPGVSTKNKVILKPKIDRFEFNYKGNISNCILIIEETFHDAYKCEEQNYVDALNETIDYIKENIDRKCIIVKLRHNSNVKNSILITHLEKRGLQYTLLPINTLIEPLLIKNSNCILIGTVSSVLYYGAIFGHKSLSNYKLIKDKPQNPFDDAEFYWDKVKRI